MTNEQSIKTTVESYLSKECGLTREQLKSQSRLFTDKLVDSIRILGLLDFCESSFQVKISPFDAIPENFDSVERIAQFILSLKRPVAGH